MQVLCGQCGQSIVVEDSQAGGLVACPRCQNQVQVPRLDEEDVVLNGDDSSLGLPPGEEEGFAGMAKQAMSRKIQVACGKCGKTLTVSARMGGRKARCPACNTQILIPYPNEGDDDAALERLSKRNHRPEQQATLMPQGAPAAPPPAQGEGVADEEPISAVPVSSRSLDTLVAAAAALNSAAAAPAPSDIPTDLAEAAAGAAADRRTRISRRMRGWMFYVALGCVAGIAIGVGAYLLLSFMGPATPGTTEVAHNPPDPAPVKGSAPSPVPATKQAPPTQPIAPPPPAVAKLSVVAAEFKDFIAGGYFPARPGHVYWELTVAVKAGNKPLSFYNYGKGVTLTTASGAYECLGSPPDTTALPLRSRREAVSLAGLEGRQIVLLFQVPVADSQGKLKLGPLEEAAVQPAPLDGPASLAGTYREAPPRNLRPMLRDPVMAAIQSAPAHQIVLKDGSARGLEVSIPAAAVSGSAQPGPDGMYQAVLRNSKDELKCFLRPMVDGNGVILYLSDQPFHQIAYARPGAPKPRPRPQPPKPPATQSQPTPPEPRRPSTGPGTLFDDPNTAGQPATRPAGESRLPVLPPKDPAPRPSLPKDHGHRTIFDH